MTLRRRQALEERRRSPKRQGRRDARRVPRRSYKYNLLDEQSACLQRRSADLRAVGRPRGRQQLVGVEAIARAPTRISDINLLAARAARAFHEMYADAREHRRAGPGLLQDQLRPASRRVHPGRAQLSRPEWRRTGRPNTAPTPISSAPISCSWLKRALLNSRATWKVIASDMPLSLIVYDDAPNKKGSEAVAQGDGPPRGRELEIADLLRFIKASGIVNTRVADRRRALHRRALLQSRQGAIPGFRAVLGIRLRPAACRHVRTERTRQHLRPRSEVHQGARRRTSKTCRRRPACSSSVMSGSTARPAR